MSSNDSSSELDSRISAIVESSVSKIRDELMHRLQDTESRLRDVTRRLGGEDEAVAVAEAPAEPAAEPAAMPSGDAAGDLFDAVVAMDRGGSQQQVLAALLEGVGRFAGRSAIFLTRADAAQGWGSYGFEESAREIQQVTLSYGEGALATLAEGHGCVALDADECARFCRQMGAAPAAEGLLVPFVLRDRLAAALYADRSDDDPPLARRSVQLLAYIGAQAVEGLALRNREATPTLQISGEAEAPAVALWEAPEPTEPPAAAEPEPVEPPAAAEPEPIEPPALAEPEPAEPPALAEPEPIEPPVAAAPEAAAEPPAEMTLEELPEEETRLEMPPTEAVPEAAAEDEWQVSAEPPAVEPAPPIVQEEEPAPEAAAEKQPWEATAGSDFATVETEPAAPAPPAEPPAAAPAPPTEAPAAEPAETTQVSPPSDVTGPGWAFTASRAAAESGDDAQHEEARRLARLLVTEIKLYNEEQVEEGRRGNDIYARLREDIDRSRQIFNERVDQAVRQETDYFHEEMVRILAGGNAEALGL